jgi:hypothetical protein
MRIWSWQTGMGTNSAWVALIALSGENELEAPLGLVPGQMGDFGHSLALSAIQLARLNLEKIRSSANPLLSPLPPNR